MGTLFLITWGFNIKSELAYLDLFQLRSEIKTQLTFDLKHIVLKLVR